MKRLVFKVIVFSLLFISVVAVLDRQIHRNRATHEWDLQFRDLYEGERSYDLIILGSSHSLSAINPMYLQGIRGAYNFSISGGNPSYYIEWFDKIFLKAARAKPRLVLYATDWFMFKEKSSGEDGNVRRFEQDSEYFSVVLLLKEMLFKPKSCSDLLYNRFEFLKYRYRLSLLLRSQKDDTLLDFNEYYRGFVPYKPKAFEGVQQRKIEKSTAQVRDFEELIRKMKGMGIGVVFVQVPEFLSGRKSDAITENNLLISEIAEREGIPFINYNNEKKSEINQEKKYFSDWGHMNADGARKFTSKLSIDLQEFGCP